MVVTGSRTAEQAGAGFDRAMGARSTLLDPIQMGTSEPAAARGRRRQSPRDSRPEGPPSQGGGQPAPATAVGAYLNVQLQPRAFTGARSRASRTAPAKTVCGSRGAREPRRTGECELVARGSVGPRGARLTTWSVAEIGERHLLRARVKLGGASQEVRFGHRDNHAGNSGGDAAEGGGSQPCAAARTARDGAGRCDG